MLGIRPPCASHNKCCSCRTTLTLCSSFFASRCGGAPRPAVRGVFFHRHLFLLAHAQPFQLEKSPFDGSLLWFSCGHETFLPSGFSHLGRAWADFYCVFETSAMQHRGNLHAIESMDEKRDRGSDSSLRVNDRVSLHMGCLWIPFSCYPWNRSTFTSGSMDARQLVSP